MERGEEARRSGHAIASDAVILGAVYAYSGNLKKAETLFKEALKEGHPKAADFLHKVRCQLQERRGAPHAVVCHAITLVARL